MSNINSQVGVNTEVEGEFSRRAFELSRETWSNSPFVRIEDWSPSGSFRGPFVSFRQNLPDGCGDTRSADGIGTKRILNTLAGMLKLSASDLVCMCVDDVTREGGVPIEFTNVLDVTTLGKHVNSAEFNAAVELIEGLRDAANKAGIVLLKGETAQLGSCVGSPIPETVIDYNWAGFVTGAVHKDYAILGERMRPGDIVASFHEATMRSNGISPVWKRILPDRYGKEWWKHPDTLTYVQRTAQPSTSYARLLAECNGWYNGFKNRIPLLGIAHTTGGGMPEKFGKSLIFKWGLSAKLDNLPEPPPLMRAYAEFGGVSDRDCYKTWHGGPGTLGVLEETYLEPLQEAARRRGFLVTKCGVITASGGTPTLEIHSKFRGKKLTYQ